MPHRTAVPTVRAPRGTVRLAAAAVTVAAAVSAPSPAWTQPRELQRAIHESPQVLPSRCHALPPSAPRIERVRTPGPVIEAQCNASMVPGLPAAVRSGTPVPGGALNFDTQQTVALRPGRWVIQPDTNTADDAFPPGFTFVVTWRE